MGKSIFRIIASRHDLSIIQFILDRQSLAFDSTKDSPVGLGA
jgi:hypothetical protein